MHRYFKHNAESEHGAGIAYLAFDGDWATRQIEIYDESVWRSDDPNDICDQPLSETDLGPAHEITAEEFEGVWATASGT